VRACVDVHVNESNDSGGALNSKWKILICEIITSDRYPRDRPTCVEYRRKKTIRIAGSIIIINFFFFIKYRLFYESAAVRGLKPLHINCIIAIL